MKKVLGCVISIGLFSLLGSSQAVIQNSAKPLSENPGRILELEELVRITDKSEEFYFKRPFRLSLDEDGIYSVVKYKIQNGPVIPVKEEEI